MCKPNFSFLHRKRTELNRHNRMSHLCRLHTIFGWRAAKWGIYANCRLVLANKNSWLLHLLTSAVVSKCNKQKSIIIFTGDWKCRREKVQSLYKYLYEGFCTTAVQRNCCEMTQHCARSSWFRKDAKSPPEIRHRMPQTPDTVAKFERKENPKQEISHRLKDGKIFKNSSSEYDIYYHRNDKHIPLLV